MSAAEAPANAGRAAGFPRYRLAAGIVTGVVAILLASTFFDYSSVKGIGARPAVAGIPVALLVAAATFAVIRGFERSAGTRRRHFAVAGVLGSLALLGWLLILNAYTFTKEAGPAATIACTLACLPTTAFGLWLVRRLDRNEKEPWRLILVAAAWGALVATSLVITAEGLWADVSFQLLVPGPGLDASVAFAAGLFEELAKGVAVLLLFLVMRDEFDDVVDGIVYGAAVGLGFNFLESIGYMTYLYAALGHNPAAAAFQWYSRQVLGLFFGHATYTALMGAGVGIARQTKSLRAAVTAIAAGWLIAIAAHFSWDAWLAFFPISSSKLALLEIHLRTLVMTGPFTAAVVALLVMGLRREGRALRQQLELEASMGLGTVLPPEVAVLISPWQRFRARLHALARGGLRAHTRLARLQRAQIELALERWHRARAETELSAAELDRHRIQIVHLRQAWAAVSR